MNKNAGDEHTNYIEVYFLVSDFTTYVRKNRQADFFDNKLGDIGKIQVSTRIFLTLHSALHYNRFLGSDYAILQAYVSDESIESYGNELVLREGYIRKSQVVGCTTDSNQNDDYYENPHFDERYLVG